MFPARFEIGLLPLLPDDFPDASPKEYTGLQRERAERERQGGQLADVHQRLQCPGSSSSYTGPNSSWGQLLEEEPLTRSFSSHHNTELLIIDVSIGYHSFPKKPEVEFSATFGISGNECYPIDLEKIREESANHFAPSQTV
ncbi:hypothetical protein NQ315_016602 [Exocentrus adspersus]|uniref:Uncharacterized protein n=1 Tax=Exocentrus adspersus TaxID=1586481 RepID=A0AAV8V602_9CUCU|nr:hypothetical protein NQ315_016602 [Exocentrus adspersus]